MSSIIKVWQEILKKWHDEEIIQNDLQKTLVVQHNQGLTRNSTSTPQRNDIIYEEVIENHLFSKGEEKKMELWVIGQSDTYSLQAKNKKVKIKP